MLPHEREVMQDISTTYRKQLAAMAALHAAVMGMLTSGDWTISRVRGLSPRVAETMIGLLAKACKTYRAVQLLSERGLYDEASALVRVLMETTIAILFILQKNSRNRALVFHAHGMSQQLKMLNDWKATPGLKRKATKAAFKQANDGIAFYTGRLPAGTHFNRHWSGKPSLHEAMKALRGEAMYASLYRYTSAIVHASDFGAQFEVNPETGNYIWEIEPRVEGSEVPTYTARQLLWLAANRIDERLGLGFAQKLAPHKLSRAEVEAGAM